MAVTLWQQFEYYYYYYYYYLYTVLWKCRATLTGYCTLSVQRILIKGTAKEKSKFGLFNGASHAVVACTAPEIGALKDRLCIPKCQ